MVAIVAIAAAATHYIYLSLSHLALLEISIGEFHTPSSTSFLVAHSLLQLVSYEHGYHPFYYCRTIIKTTLSLIASPWLENVNTLHQNSPS